MFEFSPLGKVWLLDVDGTILKHNGHLHGGDVVLDGVKEFLDNLSTDDRIILLTARKEPLRADLEKFLKENNIRYDEILYNMPFGERIVVNDEKPSGLKTAYAVNKKRDEEFKIEYEINNKL